MPDDFEVFLNGVPQRPGSDFAVEGRTLVFERHLEQEGRLGLWRWFLGAWGIGTYRQDDSVDVRYNDAAGRPQVAQGLPIEPPASDGAAG
ncbi:MAG TPA: hypothetical protein VN238_13130 [Solirubrobacteraceae bacterium]|nr:hypothetical protein [Solirubrobacteraceae bacterium]